MALIVAYVGFIFVGDVNAFLLGRAAEQWSDNIGLGVFLLCFGLVFVIAWKIAIRITKPKLTKLRA